MRRITRKVIFDVLHQLLGVGNVLFGATFIVALLVAKIPNKKISSFVCKRVPFVLAAMFTALLAIGASVLLLEPLIEPKTANGEILSVGDSGVVVEYFDEYGRKEEVAIPTNSDAEYAVGENVVVVFRTLLFFKLYSLERWPSG